MSFEREGGASRAAVQTWVRPRLTAGTLFVLGAMNLIDCINFNCLTSYVDRMVSDFLGRPTNDPQVVQTVGFLIGLYPFCEVLFSPFWGYLADRLGRRPVLLIGLGGSVIAPIVFGFAKTLPVAFLARALDGFFCGNLGVTKTYLGELVDETNEARGFSFLAVCFSFGLFLGPFLGGQLVYPAERLPGVFGGSIFEEYPYLLPNLTYVVLALTSWILGFSFLRETLPPRSQRPAAAASLGGEGAGDEEERGRDVQEERRRTKTCLSFLVLYCLLTGYYAAWTQNVVVILSLPRSISGFGFGPNDIGLLQNAAGLGLLLMQLLFYPRMTKRFGFLRCFLLGCAVNATVTLLFPVYGLLADPDKFGAWRYLPLSFMMFMGQSAAGFAFPTLFVWINRSLEGKDKGTWNGWINSMGALFRSIFPPAADALLSVGLQTNIPGGRYLPIFGNSLVCLALVALIPGAVRALERDGARRKPGTSAAQANAGSRQ